MPELDPVRQDITADATEWLATLDKMIAKAEQFLLLAQQMDQRLIDMGEAAAAAGEAMQGAADQADRLATANGLAATAAGRTASSLGDVSTSAAEAAAATGEAGDKFNYLARIAAYLSGTFGLVVASEDTVLKSSAQLAAMNQGLAESFGNIRSAATGAALSDKVLASMNQSLASSFGEAVTMARLETEQVRLLAETEAVAAGTTKALADAQRTLAASQALSSSAGVADALAAFAGGGGGGGAGATGWLASSIAWWQRWRAVIHWAVMGTMEILSTAIPAIVAFSAALVAMYPAAEFLHDHFSNLIIAAGGLSRAVASMQGPASGLAASMGRLSLAVAPDVWMIFGSAISIATAHTGVFAGIAQQASDVLGNFAAKIVSDLQGPAGKAMQDFFLNGVKFMVQWGQVLGNFGHAFLNIFHDMPGIGHVVLDVLDAMSRALLDITNIPFAGTVLGIVAALSGLYRYAILVANALRFMWAAFGGQALMGLISNFVMLTQQMGLMGASTWVVRGAITSLTASLGFIVPVAGAAVAGLELWYLNSQNVTNATKNLIQHVESMPNSVQNLSSGIVTLSGAMVTANQRAQDFTKTTTAVVQGTKMSAGLAAASKELGNDTTALSGALVTEYNRLKQVEQGLQGVGVTNGQVAANMAVLNIATGIQDSKVQQVNQAWDAYFQLLTGGMSNVANFTTALGNMTTVSSTTGLTNLQQQTSQITVTAAQFQQQLQSGAVKGASAWQNFTQVFTGSLGPTADYLRQAQQAGVITKGQFAQGILAATAAMIPYTGTTGAAANMMEAYAQQAGLGHVNLAALAQQYGTTGNALDTLNGIMTTATIGMSNASQVAKNLSAVFQQQVTQALVAAALKTSGFSTAVANMMQAQKTGMDVNGHNWQYWAQQAANDWNQAQSAVTTATNKITSDINGMPSGKTINIVVNGVISGNPYAISIAQSLGGFSTSSGLSSGKLASITAHGATGGYVHGPGTSTSDSVPAMLSRGEYVMNAAAVHHYGAGVMAAMNARKFAGGGISHGLGPSVLEASIHGGGGGIINLHSNNSMSLGGRKILRQQRTEQLKYSRRNFGSDWSLRARTGTPR